MLNEISNGRLAPVHNILCSDAHLISSYHYGNKLNLFIHVFNLTFFGLNQICYLLCFCGIRYNSKTLVLEHTVSCKVVYG